MFPPCFPQKTWMLLLPPYELAHGVEPTAAQADPTGCVSCGGEDSSELRGRSGNSSGHYITNPNNALLPREIPQNDPRFLLFDSTIMGNLMNPRGKGKDFFYLYHK